MFNFLSIFRESAMCLTVGAPQSAMCHTVGAPQCCQQGPGKAAPDKAESPSNTIQYNLLRCVYLVQNMQIALKSDTLAMENRGNVFRISRKFGI